MPCKPAKARHLLRDGKARVVRRTPFTIQLTIATGENVQPIHLGVDAGSKHIGLSATTEKEELFSSEVELRKDITDLLSSRREMRRARRNRKTRYRAPRFDNRVHAKNKGWLAPTLENKISAHLSRIKAIRAILPVSRITIEVASFDIQKNMCFSETVTNAVIVTARAKTRFSTSITLRAVRLGAMLRTISSRFARPATRLITQERFNLLPSVERNLPMQHTWESCVGNSLREQKKRTLASL